MAKNSEKMAAGAAAAVIDKQALAHDAGAGAPPAATSAAGNGAATGNGGGATATARVAVPLRPTTELRTAVSIPATFRFDEVRATPSLVGLLDVTPALGPLAEFTGNWSGHGFNTIFRPDSSQTPTPLPSPAGGDNVLELNLTNETLSFSPSLGSVPNRGMVQGDAFLNGVPYLQAISDVTTGTPIGIHLEPGLWMAVPDTADPQERTSLVRMASIPHGTTICAQGTWSDAAGAPVIPSVPITPHFLGGGPIRFPSQTAAQGGTARIPQDLSSFISAGTITQAILDDPNTVLRNAIAGQTITHTTTIQISTAPPTPLFGGGTDNIAFLLGVASAQTNPNGSGQNAQTVQMNATFWIETVQHTILLPILEAGRQVTLPVEGPGPEAERAQFIVRPPFPIPHPRPITFTTKQIQYSQTVFLNFNGLGWPHVSVATLTPAGTATVPSSAWQS
jgi:hypothetical protein